MSLLSTATAVVRVPLERAAAVLTGTGPDGPWLFDAVEGARASGAIVEFGECSAALQGGWWYRGEYQLTEHPQGALLTLRVRNVARRGRLLVPLVLLSYRRSGVVGPEATERAVADLARRLERAAA